MADDETQDKTNHVHHVQVKTLYESKLVKNECRWQGPKKQDKVRMVRVVVYYYKDAKGKNIDTVSMECCAEHQEKAVTSLIQQHGLKR